MAESARVQGLPDQHPVQGLGFPLTYSGLCLHCSLLFFIDNHKGAVLARLKQLPTARHTVSGFLFLCTEVLLPFPSTFCGHYQFSQNC